MRISDWSSDVCSSDLTLAIPEDRHGGRDVTIFRDGESWHFGLADLLDGEDEDAGGGDRITAPMPGLVKLLRVSVGQVVTAGETLAVMEAMQMELALVAPPDSRIAESLSVEGDQVLDGAVLLTLEAYQGTGHD